MTPYHDDTARRFGDLTTAHLADACVRAGVGVRCMPAGTGPVDRGSHAAGRALPARHAGSVDVFLEALQRSRPGDVLVVDNGGRLDQACIGDLVVQEASAAGLAALVVWGLHRDTADIRAIGLPVWSLGSFPTGPLLFERRADDALDAAQVGGWTVTPADVVFADDDGVIFVAGARVDDVLAIGERIRDAERRQANSIGTGTSLRAQLDFSGFLAVRGDRPDFTFREHLRAIEGAIEE